MNRENRLGNLRWH